MISSPRFEDIFPVEITNELDCRSCGACCQDITSFPLNRREANLLRWAGTQLVVPHGLSRRRLKNPEAVVEYRMVGRCAFLLENSEGVFSCSIYTSPDRPQACALTEQGSRECLDMVKIKENDSIQFDLKAILIGKDSLTMQTEVLEYV